MAAKFTVHDVLSSSSVVADRLRHASRGELEALPQPDAATDPQKLRNELGQKAVLLAIEFCGGDVPTGVLLYQRLREHSSRLAGAIDAAAVAVLDGDSVAVRRLRLHAYWATEPSGSDAFRAQSRAVMSAAAHCVATENDGFINAYEIYSAALARAENEARSRAA